MAVDVVVFDDNPDLADDLVTSTRKGLRKAGLDWKTSQADATEVQKWVDTFSPTEPGKTAAAPAENMDPWRNTKVIILDADLRRHRVQTAEKLAYWIRCFSDVGVVVAVNPEPQRTFDLNLREMPQPSWMDLGVYPEDLENPGLWKPRSRTEGYRPWYWASLSDLATRRKRMNAQAQKGLPEKVEDFLDIPAPIREAFPRRLFDAYISSLSATLREIADARIHKADAELIDDAGKGRIAAATLRWWLENVVHPGQDILVDAPHLASRYPSLLDRITRFHASSLGVPGTKLPKKMTTKAMQEIRFGPAEWLDRPAWWFPLVSSSEEIAEIASPKSFSPLPWVFAEDTSMFHPEKPCKPFSLASTGIFARRYVRRPRDAPAHYEPAGYLLKA